MKALWWYEDDFLAGMARPGLNGFRWFDLSFEEGVLMGWLGLHSSETLALTDFFQHVETYAPKIRPFYPMISNHISTSELLELFSLDRLAKVFRKLQARTLILNKYEIEGNYLHLEYSHARLYYEMEHLKRLKIQKIIGLTERHHHQEILAQEFSTCHLPINDLSAPQLEQAQELAGLIQQARTEGQRVAVHCLAGIGRTSTMILAAHLLLGESLDKLKLKIAKQNPSFGLMGSQAKFLEQLAQKLGACRSF